MLFNFVGKMGAFRGRASKNIVNPIHNLFAGCLLPASGTGNLSSKKILIFWGK